MRSMSAGVVGLAMAVATTAAAKPPPEGSVYVALGSSYAAGPGVGQQATDSPGRCGQSAENYARQVAGALKLKLVDRSCGGATTADILGGGPLGLPAQIEGVAADARLVSVTIGGNDVRYMADLSVGVCHKSPELFPEPARARACAPPAGFDLEKAFATVEANLRTIATETHRRAPQARLVFVDYVTVLPAGAPCPGVNLTQADMDELRTRAERLEHITAKVAKDAHADLVMASTLSRGHDACAADPWVWGYVARREAGGWGPVSFHPRPPAMTAIAGALEQTLKR